MAEFLEYLKDIIKTVISSGLLLGIILIIKDKTDWKRNRKAEKADKQEEKADELKLLKEQFSEFKHEQNKRNDEQDEKMKAIENKSNAIGEGVKQMLLDRIIYLGKTYIKKGEISFDDRKRLHDMHSAYHNGLNGNGDADLIMSGVDELPLSD